MIIFDISDSLFHYREEEVEDLRWKCTVFVSLFNLKNIFSEQCTHIVDDGD